MTLWRIPAGVPFADALAAELLARSADNPLRLAEMLVLLPTRRACRTVREAFLRQSQGKPLLLPQLTPLGDIDADELALSAGVELPPALTPRRRELLLTQLVKKYQTDWPLAQCLAMSRELARLMDDIAIEGADSTKLEDLVTKREIAEHWQITLRFLRPVFAAWPAILAEEGCLDGAERRNRLMKAQAEAWQKNPPATPVIAAGSMGSIPATAGLLKAVLALPQGEVVLPGLPSWEQCKDWWDKVDPPHPFFGLRELLQHLETDPAQIKLWGKSAGDETRQNLLHRALLPSAATGAWAGAEPLAANNITRADCTNEQEEATVIALKLRETLETPGKTAMLVTPDRMLGRRVAEQLGRWGVAVDDSAGTPLAKTAPAIFLRALLDYAENRGPVAFLALMKHPLAAGGLSLAECRKRVRWLDEHALRGPKPEGGLKEWACHTTEEIANWLLTLNDKLSTLLSLLPGQTVSLPVFLQTLIGVAEVLATTDEEQGRTRLWRGAAGEALADWVADLLAAASDFPPLPVREAVPLFSTLLGTAVVRPRQNDHPRLVILGPMEARLQSADVVVLAGLNEGTWPAPPAPDPWLSRPMRTDFGLRPPEQRIGQEAHDFCTLAAAPELLLTRSTKQGGTPTVPARWLQRLELVAPEMEKDTRLLHWARQMEHCAVPVPAPRPAPCPPVSARPDKLSVTGIEKLLRDPYAIYAKHILRLSPLDELEAEAGAAERGTFIHKVLKRTLDETHTPNHERILAIAEEELVAAGLSSQKAWWWPRMVLLADWLENTQRQRVPQCRPLALEVKGLMEVDGFTLTAQADRIDQTNTGQLVIIDYKTGSVPQGRDKKQFSQQLPLEAAILKAGGFSDVPSATMSKLEIWKIGGSVPPCEISDFDKKKTPDMLADEALAGLKMLIAEYRRPETCYPSEPHGEERYSDYKHLARVKEWASADEEDGE